MCKMWLIHVAVTIIASILLDALQVSPTHKMMSSINKCHIYTICIYHNTRAVRLVFIGSVFHSMMSLFNVIVQVFRFVLPIFNSTMLIIHHENVKRLNIIVIYIQQFRNTVFYY